MTHHVPYMMYCSPRYCAEYQVHTVSGFFLDNHKMYIHAVDDLVVDQLERAHREQLEEIIKGETR